PSWVTSFRFHPLACCCFRQKLSGGGLSINRQNPSLLQIIGHVTQIQPFQRLPGRNALAVPSLEFVIFAQQLLFVLFVPYRPVVLRRPLIFSPQTSSYIHRPDKRSNSLEILP